MRFFVVGWDLGSNTAGELTRETIASTLRACFNYLHIQSKLATTIISIGQSLFCLHSNPWDYYVGTFHTLCGGLEDFILKACRTSKGEELNSGMCWTLLTREQKYQKNNNDQQQVGKMVQFLPGQRVSILARSFDVCGKSRWVKLDMGTIGKLLESLGQ